MMKNRLQIMVIALLGIVLATCGKMASRPSEEYGKGKHGIDGSLMQQPVKMRNAQGLLLQRKAYTTNYNFQAKIPNWVAWRLTADHVDGSVSRKHFAFHEDMDVKIPRATLNDYFNTGFDRGHMCPAGDNRWDRQAMEETFLLTNICPQVHALNNEGWNDLEMACRRWAKKYGEVYIVCGPILEGTRHRTIGKNKIVVPKKFFKVIYMMRGTPMAIGFIYQNSSKNSRKMFSNATNVDEIERITGMDFFPMIPDAVENRIEADRGYF